MGRPEAHIPGRGFDDADVWDRIRSLAPLSEPVPGRLFKRADAKKTFITRDVAPVPALATAAAPAEDPETRAARAWARLRVATVAKGAVSRPGGLAGGDAAMAEATDLLRTRLLGALRDHRWRRIAVASPTPGCGTTFTACALTQSLSRIHSVRTVLLDMNLRAPGVARTLGLSPSGNVADMLTGKLAAHNALIRYAENVSVGLTSNPSTHPAEVLHDARCAKALARIEEDLRPDVMLFDLPPVLVYDDVAAVLPNVDGVLIVADATRSTAREIADCERAIAGRTKLLGVVLNRGRGGRRAMKGYA